MLHTTLLPVTSSVRVQGDEEIELRRANMDLLDCAFQGMKITCQAMSRHTLKIINSTVPGR